MIFTIGHSTRPIDEFIDLLTARASQGFITRTCLASAACGVRERTRSRGTRGV